MNCVNHVRLELKILMEYQGLVIGLLAFLMVRFFRYIVGKYEYIFSGRLWLCVLTIGIIAVISSFFINEIIISTLVAIFGCVCLWAIYEKKVKK